jgi:N-methylhydantoinase A
MTYGHASPGEPVQLVNLRVAAVGKLDGLDLGRPPAAPPATAAAGQRDVYFKETGLLRGDVLARDALAPGAEGKGPVIVEATDTTVVVPPGWRWRVDARGFIILEAIAHE